jgi:hypothetical protein
MDVKEGVVQRLVLGTDEILGKRIKLKRILHPFIFLAAAFPLTIM